LSELAKKWIVLYVDVGHIRLHEKQRAKMVKGQCTQAEKHKEVEHSKQFTTTVAHEI
jgi:hypothetical protein